MKTGQMDRIPSILVWRTWMVEHLLMPWIFEFTKVVQDAIAHYGEIFSIERQRRHFAEPF